MLVKKPLQISFNHKIRLNITYSEKNEVANSGDSLTLVTVTSLPFMAVNVKNVSADTLFYDDFNDGIADSWTPQIGSWSVIGGEYFISVGIIENGISTVDGLYLTDCTIETRFRFTDNVGYRAGLVFRYMKKDTYYSLELSNEYDALCFVKYLPECAAYGTQDHGFVGTAPTEIHFASGELSVGRQVINSTQIARIDKGVDYTLRVTTTSNVFVGELISDGFYQKIVWEDTDNPFNYGTVGLRARRADVNFDYFKIENATISEIKPEPLNPELMAWWKLDEGNGTVVLDSSGYEYHGTVNGANWLNYQGDSSLNFDGESDYVSLPSIDLTQLDALTVVARINSDLTQVGDFIYSGNLGEFSLSNGDLEEISQQGIDINPTRAKFSIKLANYQWYKVDSSFPMKQNMWHQVVGVWEKGKSIKVYVDGILAGENKDIPSERLYNPGASFPSSLGIYAQARWSNEGFFKGQLSNVMIFNTALTPQEIKEQYDVPVPVVPRPILDFSCKSSTSNSGFNVEINGDLTLEGTAVPDAPILLSYSVTGGKTWKDLTLVYTDKDGHYSTTWLPSVTGNYLLKAYYEGDINNLPASSQINFALTTVTEENTIFSVSSNSTVTALQFNSTASELSFTVSGPSGTKGYVKCAIAKSLVSNPESIKLFLDGNQLSYDVTSTEVSWLLFFTYSHSAHRISINLPRNAIEVLVTDQDHWIWVAATSITVVIGISLLVYLKKRQHKT